jgi:hypothetical protein
MNEYVVHGSLAMTRGSVLRIEDGCDLLIYVWEGSLWVTQEGDTRDRHLGAGGWFRLDRDGVAIASATSRSTITVTAPEPELYAKRIALARAQNGVHVELYSAAKARPRLGARLRRFWAGLFAPHARPTTASL